MVDRTKRGCMKPKSKTLKTETKVEEPKPAAIATTTKATVWDALDKITKELSPGNTRSVQEHVHGIQTDLKVLHETKDSICAHLAAIHTLIGKDGFAKFAEDVMPRFGVSKSSVYRWLESGQLVKVVIPDLGIRQTLVGRMDKPLTTTDSKTGEVKLLPAFESALKAVPMPVMHDDGKGNKVYRPEDVDAYTAAVAAKTRELGKGKGKTKAQLKKARKETIIEKFQAYMEEYGTEDAEALLNELDQLHTAEAKTITVPAKPAIVGKAAGQQ